MACQEHVKFSIFNLSFLHIRMAIILHIRKWALSYKKISFPTRPPPGKKKKKEDSSNSQPNNLHITMKSWPGWRRCALLLLLLPLSKTGRREGAWPWREQPGAGWPDLDLASQCGHRNKMLGTDVPYPHGLTKTPTRTGSPGPVWSTITF